MRKRVWITGAAGFSGRHLIEYLRSLKQPLEIIGLDCREFQNPGLDACHAVDLTRPDSCRELALRNAPDYVIHLAGLLPPAPEGELWRVNVGGTHNLVQTLGRAVCGKRNHKIRFLTIGSAAEYLPSKERITEDHPCGGVSDYGRTKWAQSMIALAAGREHGVSVMIARPFNLLGPGLSSNLVAGSLCEQFARGIGPIKVGNLNSYRDFVDIRDAVRAYWQVATRGRQGEAYNVCSGRAIKIGRLVDLFASESRSEQPVKADQARLRGSDLDRVYGENSKLKSVGWRPEINNRLSIRNMLKCRKPGN